MNFKGWEKLQEDAKSVVLKHPHGHTMTIAVKALPKILQEQIKYLKFAEGGEIEEEGISEQGKDVRMAKKLKKRGDPDHKMHEKFAKEEAKGRAEAEREMVKPKLKGLAKGGEIHAYEDGSDDEPVSSQDNKSIDSSQAPADAGRPINITVNGAPAQAPQPVVNSPMPIVGQSAPVAPVQPNIPQMPAPNGSSLQNEARKTLQGVDAGRQSLELQEKIDAAKAQAAVPATAEAISGEQALAAQNARAYNEIMQHTQDFNDYINKHPIDPRHYQESMSSGQKTAAGIGLFLGGLGTSFGGHNFAFDALQKQIDRDLDAQKQNVHNQQTVLGAWQDLYGKNNISTALAKASLNDIMAKKLQLSAAQLGTAQAHANMLQGVSALNAQSAQLRNEAAALAGPAKAAGQLPSGGQGHKSASGKPADQDHILRPEANNLAQTLKFNTLNKEQVPAIMEQKAKAALADKAIDTIKEKFPQLYENTGGAGGYLRRKGHLLGSIPYAGPVIESATDYVTDTNKNAAYDSDYTSLVGAVRGALQGNVSEDLLDSTVRKNAPETNDPPELKKRKLQNMIDFIRAHTKTDLLEPAGLTNKGR